MSRLVASPVLAAIGWIMIGLGVFLVVRSVMGADPVTSARVLDLAFALFFLVRGLMNIRKARRVRQPTP